MSIKFDYIYDKFEQGLKNVNDEYRKIDFPSISLCCKKEDIERNFEKKIRVDFDDLDTFFCFCDVILAIKNIFIFKKNKIQFGDRYLNKDGSKSRSYYMTIDVLWDTLFGVFIDDISSIKEFKKKEKEYIKQVNNDFVNEAKNDLDLCVDKLKSHLEIVYNAIPKNPL